MTARNPDTVISFCARIHLAKELGLAPDELEYVGMQEGLDYRPVLFKVEKPGDVLDRSTRSVRVDL